MTVVQPAAKADRLAHGGREYARRNLSRRACLRQCGARVVTKRGRAPGSFECRVTQRLAHLAANRQRNCVCSLTKPVSEFEKRPRTELRVIRPTAGVKGFSRGGDCGSSFNSPACRVLPEHLPGGRAYGICDRGRTDPLAIDPMTRGLNLWGCFATIHFAAPLGKASCFLER
jgi:hypothetical protein